MAVHASTEDVTQVIGFTGITALIEARGGTEFRIPQQPSPQLEQWLGVAQAQALCEAFSGCKIDVPNGKATPSVRARVVQLIERGGLSENDIASAIGCTGRTVRKHRDWWRRQKTGTVPGRNAAQPQGNPAPSDNGHSETTPAATRSRRS